MKHQTPYPVASAIVQFGRNIALARLRRNWTRDFLGQKCGLHRNVIARAEAGSESVRIATYFSILWALGLLDQVTDLASPDQDAEGTILERAKTRKRASNPKALDNDF